LKKFYVTRKLPSTLKNVTSAELSVILTTPDCYDTIRKTIACLRAQTARDRLEIVIVAPTGRELKLCESELKSFANFHVVEVKAIESIGAANAAGVRDASAPLVAFGEDHAFPDPEWAEALIAAHKQNWVAVGPAVRNANPGSLISWADFLIAYGPWMECVAAGVAEHLPGHNSSYKRSVLIEYGSRLETMLEAESVLHWDLSKRGYELCCRLSSIAAGCLRVSAAGTGPERSGSFIHVRRRLFRQSGCIASSGNHTGSNPVCVPEFYRC
jgi:hypothetical protein